MFPGAAFVTEALGAEADTKLGSGRMVFDFDIDEDEDAGVSGSPSSSWHSFDCRCCSSNSCFSAYRLILNLAEKKVNRTYGKDAALFPNVHGNGGKPCLFVF